MKHQRKYSDCDSLQQKDEVNIHYFDNLKSIQHYRSASALNIQSKYLQRQIDITDQPQHDQHYIKPRLTIKQNHKKSSTNPRSLFRNTQCPNRRPFTTTNNIIKLKKKLPEKKNDPVALFQQTIQAWKKVKFLSNKANNKQGRKLELIKKNKGKKLL